MINLMVFFIGLFALGQTLLSQWNASHVLFLTGQILAPFLFFSSAAFCFLNFLQLSSFRHTLSWAFALIIWSLLTLFLGKLNLLKPQFVMATWCCLWIPELYFRFQGTRLAFNSFKNYLHSEKMGSFVNGFVWLGILILFLNSWVLHGMRGALFPPLEFDLSLIHLSLPKVYIEQEELVNTWWLRGAFLLQLPHLLYTSGILFLNSFGVRGDLFPAFLSTFYFILSGLALQEFSGQKGIAKYLFGIGLLLPVVRWSLSTSYLDVFNAYLILICCFSLFLYFQTRTLLFLWSTLLFAVIAFTAKYFAAVLLFPIFVFALGIFVFANRNSAQALKTFSLQVLLFIPIALGLIFLFGWQNFQSSGNPVFPFLAPFNPENQYFWNDEDMRQFSGAIAHWKDRIESRYFLTILFELPRISDKLSDTPNFNINLIWPLVVSISLFSAWIHRKKSLVPLALFLAGVCMLYCWMISSPVIRYLQPAIMIIIASLTWCLTLYKWKWVRFFLMASIVAVFVWQPGPLIWTPFEQPPLTKSEATDFVRAHKLGFKSAEYLKDNSDPTDIVYTMLMEDLWLYMPRPFIGDWFGMNTYGIPLQFKDGSEFKKFVSERDLHYFMIQSDSLKALFERDLGKFLGSYISCLQLVFEEGPVKTFKINRNHDYCFDSNIPQLKMIPALKENSAKELMPFWPRKKR